MKQEIWHGDCLDLMDNIPNKSVDMILCDLPYGSTKCKWDVVIPFDKLWANYNRIIKDNGAIVLFGSEPFSSLLRISNLKNFRYDWIWDKKKAANFAQSGFQPMKYHEIISVFYMKKSKYFPIKTDAIKKRKIDIPRDSTEARVDSGFFKRAIYSQAYEPDKILPKSIISFSKDNYRSNIFHPTQKPVALCEYLIKTYTDENDLVLDNCAGSGSTLVAAKNLNRQFIGIEKEKEYYDICLERLK